MRHHWTELDDLAAIYVFRFKVEDLPYSLEEVADKLGIGHASFKMRLRNYHALAGDGGLSNFASQTKSVYERHCTTPQEELLVLAFPELANARK